MTREDQTELQAGQEAEERILHIEMLVMNAAYFINKLRRKQAMIKLKKEITEATEKRDENITLMTERIREVIMNLKDDLAFLNE